MSRFSRPGDYRGIVQLLTKIAELRTEIAELRAHECRQADRLRVLEKGNARLRATLASLKAFGSASFNPPRVSEGS